MKSNPTLVVKLQVATALTQEQVLATTAREQIRSYILHGYEKNVHPNNEVHLTYQINYMECPIPDPSTGTLISNILEAQVRSASFSS